MEYKLEPNYRIWITSFLFLFLSTGQLVHGLSVLGLRGSNLCKGDGFPKSYSRGSYYTTCCKEQLLVEPKGSTLSAHDEFNCSKRIIQDNPDDDLATSMWKTKMCKIKNLMGSSEEQINYKALVDFLTQNYTTENNVQSLIRDSNTECPEGDSQSEEHEKIRAYLTCFYKNEQKVCEAPWSNITMYHNHILSLRNAGEKTTSSCDLMPGVWNQKYFCCNGKQTPEQWNNNMRTFALYSHDENLPAALACESAIHAPYAAKISNYFNYTMLRNATAQAKLLDVEFGLSCFEACRLNPMMFSNGTASESMDWKVDSVLDRAFTSYTTKVTTDLKEIVLKQKATAKVGLTMSDHINGTGITFEEIETQYPAAENAQKIKYYCSYYRTLQKLVRQALKEYCTPDSN